MATTKVVKVKTNEQLFRALFRDLTTVEVAMLRDRVQKIAQITREDINGENRQAYNNFVLSVHDWARLLDKIDNHLGLFDQTQVFTYTEAFNEDTYKLVYTYQPTT